MSLDVLLVEGWMAGSHRAWADGWQRRSRHRVHVVSQPGTHWQHRMAAGAVPLADATARHVEQHGRPDVVVATDMVDVASYLGLCGSMMPGGLTGVPIVLYMHENQFTQPPSPNGVGVVRGRHLAWTNWRSLVAADHIWSNSTWQLSSMIDAIEDLLAEAPDARAQLSMLDRVRSRCTVRPVGCDLAELLTFATAETGRCGEPPLVLWNHRWSADKGLDRAVTSLATLASDGVEFELAVAGEDEHHDPAHGERMLAPVCDRIVHRGWLEPVDYRRLLMRADVVVAAPLQENFGISVVEAVAAGCVPVVPDGLAFTETIDEAALRYPPGRLTTQLRNVLGDLCHYRDLTRPVRARLGRFDWATVAGEYDSAVEELV